MQLATAMFDDISGEPIVVGQIELDDDTTPSLIPPHDHVLFCLRPYRGIPPTITIWPVTGMRQKPNGFYECVLGRFAIHLHPLSIRHLSMLCRQESEDHSISYQGTSFGFVVREADNKCRHVRNSVIDIRIEAKNIGDGVRVDISGHVAISDASPPFFSSGVQPDIVRTRLRIRAVLTIEQINLIGYDGPFDHLHFVKSPQGKAISAVPANSGNDGRKLRSVMIRESLKWPVVHGSLQFVPGAPETLARQGGDNVGLLNIIEFGDNSLRLWDARHVELVDNGSVRATASYYHVNIDMFGRKLLERGVKANGSFSLFMTGDEIGDLTYKTMYGREPGDPLGRISQSIRSLALHALLSESQLELSMDCELNGFDPGIFEKHKSEAGSMLEPLARFKLKAELPAALLLVRGFALPDRTAAMLQQFGWKQESTAPSG